MFKQPAENTNATPLEEKRSKDRVAMDPDRAAEQAEIEAEAQRLASERGSVDGYSEDDWAQAERIVRNRKVSLSKA